MLLIFNSIFEDSSNQSSGSGSGTLKKDNRIKNRRKWSAFLGTKSKTLNRNGDISVEEFNKRHSAVATVPRLPIPSTISKDTMVSTVIFIKFFFYQ